MWLVNPMTLLFLAGAVLVTTVGWRPRVGAGTQKNPRDGPPAKADPLDVAADIELFAACLQSGTGVAQSVAAVAEAASSGSQHTWRMIASLLAVGVEPRRAWAPAAGIDGLDDVANLVVLSESSGAAIATGCQRIVTRLRADLAAHATANAERAGVLIALPLALCFLPAFIVLGLIPVVISLGSQLF